MQKHAPNEASARDMLERMQAAFDRTIILAKGGTDRIGECQMRVWETRSELEGIGALLQCIGTGAEITPEELFGIGTSLQRLAKRLEKIEDRLGRALVATEANPALHE